MKKLPAIFPGALLLAACILLLITCRKEYSYEGGQVPESAVYTFSGAGSVCTGSLVNGYYYVGKGMDASDSVELEVTVTKAGTYNISTNTADGIYFSGSGTFSRTGIQKVNLVAAGTPAATGSFSYKPPAASACSFTITVMTEPPAIASFTLSGAPDKCVTSIVSGQYTAGTAMVFSNTVTISISVTKTGAYAIRTDTLDGISFSNTGQFTTTGTQNVMLTASGTPPFARNLTFTPLGGTSSCTFDLTVLTPGAPATYVIESNYGTPNPCTYVVSGDYVVGVPLSSANTVRINVYVAAIGSYTIATTTVNGMLFAATGNFTTTGVQYVFLQGTGTPTQKGIAAFGPQIIGPHPLGGQTCAFNINVP